MVKGPFGLSRLSDALDFITPKKLKKKYFRKEDEEDMMLSEVSIAKVSESKGARVEESKGVRVEESYVGSDVSCPTVKDFEGPRREEESPPKKEQIKV